MRHLLRDRDFRLLLGGQTLSMFGDTAMLLTLGMWAKDLTGSNAAAASVFVALGLPALLAPLGGVVIDRFRRRHVMIAVDLLTALALLGLLAVHDEGDLWVIYLVAVAYGASLVLFQSARSALLHSMLPEEELGPANGALSTVREALRLIGPATGAGLYALFGGHVTALVDAATFLVSAAFLLAMRVHEPKPQPTGREPFRDQVSAGFRHLSATPVLRAATLSVVAAMVALGLSESVYFAVVDEGLGKPVTYLGLLQTAMGVGAVVGGLTITGVIRRTGELRPVAVGLALVATGAALSLVPTVAAVLVAMALIGAGLPVTVVCLTTALQRRTPAALQGRVFTTFETLVGVPQVGFIAVGAALIDVVDYRLLLVVMAVSMGLASLYAFVRLREETPASVLPDQPVRHDQPAVGLHPLEQPPVVGDQQQRPVVRPQR